MGWVCVPQVKCLMRADPKPRQRKGKPSLRPPKHSASGRKFLLEMGDERQSRSGTLDKSLSYRNIYDQEETSGAAVWDDLCDYVKHHKQKVMVKVKDDDGSVHTEVREREVRQDKIIAVATIIKPPAEVINSWTDEEKDRFFSDAEEVLHEYDSEIYGADTKLFGVRHRDEAGEHKHLVNRTIDEDGRSEGSRIERVEWLQGLTGSFTESMQARGWGEKGLEMPELTDWQRFKSDPDYADECRTRWERSGRSQSDVAMDFARQKIDEAGEIIEEAREDLKEAERQETEKKALTDLVRSRDKKSAEREASLNTRETKIKVREDALSDPVLLAREKAVKDREDDVTARENDVTARENDVTAREAVLSDESLLAREKAVKDREEAEDEREKDFDARVTEAVKTRLQAHEKSVEMHKQMGRAGIDLSSIQGPGLGE